MVLKIREKEIHTSAIIGFLCLLYVLLMSGTVLQIFYMGLFQKWNLYVAILLAGIYFCKNPSLRSRLDLQSVFMVFAFLSVLIIPILWEETAIYSVYLANYCLLLTPWLITQFVELERFKKIYLRTMFVLVSISLVLFYIPNLLAMLPKEVMVRSNDGWSYDFYYLYAQYTDMGQDIYNRNIGIFWEPGMYQGFVIFAMMLTAIDKPLNKATFFYQLVMTVCILSIQSTTGYILLIPIVLIYILKIAQRIGQRIRTCAVILVMLMVILLVVFPNILYNLLPESVHNKLDTNNLSFSTRIYGMLADILLVIRNPLGVGVVQLEQQREVMLNSLNAISDGANVNSSITMMLYYGLVPGVLYFCICVKACMRMTSDRFINMILLIMCLVIINTEPHYLTLFFTTIFFFYSRNDRKVLELSQQQVLRGRTDATGAE